MMSWLKYFFDIIIVSFSMVLILSTERTSRISASIRLSLQDYVYIENSFLGVENLKSPSHARHTLQHGWQTG